jgi:DNA-binding transcriptional MerR regulator
MRRMMGLLVGAALVMASGGCGVDAFTRADLSMRFTHPELYQSREYFARDSALYQMRDLGLLKRGMPLDDVRQLLGEPEEEHEPRDAQGESIEGLTDWTYSLVLSGLTIRFDKDFKATEFRLDFDEGDRWNKPEIW